jgi:hypothetical protein
MSMLPGPFRQGAGSPVLACPNASAARANARRVLGSDRQQLESLLGDLGGRVQRGVGAREQGLRRHPSGLQAIDGLLGGGFPAGRLSEITGPLCSGRTSLALSLLAGLTRAGELVAVVDRPDAFDPPSARAAGVDLDRVLWARAGESREALRCSERLLETEGFALVLLDLSLPDPGPSGSRRRDGRPQAAPAAFIARAVWIRLARLAAGTGTALVVLSGQRLAGTQAETVLEMQPARPRFQGRPALLEEVETRAVLVRQRAGPAGGEARLRLSAFSSCPDSPPEALDEAPDDALTDAAETP